MSLGDHLRELWRRLIIAAIALIVGTGFGWWAAQYVFIGLEAPINQVAEETGHTAALNFDVIAGSLDLTLQIAFTIGIVVSSPVWLYQIWAFIVPGLKKRERAYTYGFLGAAIPLFIIGCGVGWIVFPRIVVELVSFAPADSIANLAASSYFDFILKLMILSGVAFVLPVFLVLLDFIGILSAKSLLKGWRIAVVAIVAFTAATTPATDILSMLALAVPMLVLYFLAVGISWVHDRRQARKQAAFLASDLPADVAADAE